MKVSFNVKNKPIVVNQYKLVLYTEHGDADSMDCCEYIIDSQKISHEDLITIRTELGRLSDMVDALRSYGTKLPDDLRKSGIFKIQLSEMVLNIDLISDIFYDQQPAMIGFDSLTYFDYQGVELSVIFEE